MAEAYGTFDKTKTYRSWTFTLNNPTEQITWSAEKVRYAIWQEEKAPTTGTIHYQGFCQLKRDQRLSYVRKLLPRAKWMPRYKHSTNEAAISDFEKSESKIAGPWTFGKIVSKGRRTDIEECKALLDAGATELEVAEQHFETWIRCGRSLAAYRQLMLPKRTWQTEVHVRWGNSGTGKTRYVWDTVGVDKLVAMYICDKQNNFWSPYDGEEHVLWDDFQPDWVSRGEFLRLTGADPMKIRVPYGPPRDDGTSACRLYKWVPRVIWITSNCHPSEWYGDDPAIMRRMTSITHVE